MDSGRRQFSAVLLPVVILTATFLVFTCLGGTIGASAAPPATGVDLAGRQVDPLYANPGKAVVLIFVRTDCPISNRYAPTIQRISAAYAGKAAFWLVYPDKTESSAAIEKHLHEYGYKLPALHDPQHALVKLGHAQVTPEVAVFDAGGQLVYHGRIDNWYVSFGHARPAPTTHELDDAIQAALKGNKPPVATASGIGCYISDLE
jgi:thiol-disulfide isomerase/thioredoxin